MTTLFSSDSEFLNSLLNGERKHCSALIRKALDQQGNIIPVYEEIIKPSLYHVGELWENNKITVASEHMATSIVEFILNEIYVDIISEHRLGKKVVVACVENEFHQVGIKMVADVFEKNGWDTCFLGANVPTSDLISFIKIQNPVLLALSFSIISHLSVLERMLMHIQNSLPNLPVLVGGQAFTRGGTDLLSKYNNVYHLSSLSQLEAFIINLNNKCSGHGK